MKIVGRETGKKKKDKTKNVTVSCKKTSHLLILPNDILRKPLHYNIASVVFKFKSVWHDHDKLKYYPNIFYRVPQFMSTIKTEQKFKTFSLFNR